MSKEAKPRFELILEPVPSDLPVTTRLRGALKMLLRSFGLRNVSIRELPAEPVPVKADEVQP